MSFGFIAASFVRTSNITVIRVYDLFLDTPATTAIKVYEIDMNDSGPVVGRYDVGKYDEVVYG